jgi:hypothetical protein
VVTAAASHGSSLATLVAVSAAAACSLGTAAVTWAQRRHVGREVGAAFLVLSGEEMIR